MQWSGDEMAPWWHALFAVLVFAAALLLSGAV